MRNLVLIALVMTSNCLLNAQEVEIPLMQVSRTHLELQRQIYQLLIAYQKLQKNSTSSTNSDMLYNRTKYVRELQQLTEEVTAKLQRYLQNYQFRGF